MSAPAGRFARCSSRSTRPKGSTLLASRRAAARVWLELRGVRVWLEPRRGWIVSLGARVSVAAATLRVVNAGGRSRTMDCPACSVRGRLRSRCTGRPTEARAQPYACGHHAGSFESVRLIEDGWRLDPSVPLASFVDGGCGVFATGVAGTHRSGAAAQSDANRLGRSRPDSCCSPRMILLPRVGTGRSGLRSSGQASQPATSAPRRLAPRLGWLLSARRSQVRGRPE